MGTTARLSRFRTERKALPSRGSGEPAAGRGLGRGGPRVARGDVVRPALDGEVDVGEAAHAQLRGERPGLGAEALDLVVGERVGWQRTGGGAGVDAGLLRLLPPPP